MEFQPDGMVNLMLVLPDGTKENYTWNKVRFENKKKLDTYIIQRISTTSNLISQVILVF